MTPELIYIDSNIIANNQKSPESRILIKSLPLAPWLFLLTSQGKKKGIVKNERGERNKMDITRIPERQTLYLSAINRNELEATETRLSKVVGGVEESRRECL